jgi:hypothetical protein
LDDVADGIWKLVDRIAGLQDGARVFLVEPTHPGGDGGRGDQQVSGGLRHRPSSGSAKLEDRQPLDRRIRRTPLGWDTQHPGVLDAHLFNEEGDLLPESVLFLLEPDTCVPVINGPASGVGQREPGERGRVDDTADRTVRVQPLGKGIRGSPCIKPPTRIRGVDVPEGG